MHIKAEKPMKVKKNTLKEQNIELSLLFKLVRTEDDDTFIGVYYKSLSFY